MLQLRRKFVGILILELVIFLIAYVVDRSLGVLLKSQTVPEGPVGLIWLEAAAWILLAACNLLFAYAVLVRARGDLEASILVGIVGLFTLAIPPLAYTPGIGDLIPNWLLRVASGTIGLVPVVSAWALTVGVVGIAIALSARRGNSAS